MESRFELKYVISYAQRDAFLKAAGDLLMPDPHGVNAKYRITSQYYDAPDMACYWAKIDGEGRRKKIRTRYYGSPDSPEELKRQIAFLEIKHRLNACVYKERTKLPGELANKLLDNTGFLSELATQLPSDKEGLALIKKIEKLYRNCHLHAANIVSYVRCAWLGVHDHRLRVTFDSEIEAFPPDQYVPKFGHGKLMVPEKRCIMEIKFNRVIPTWIKECIVISNAQMQRYSKYAHGLEALKVV